MTVDADILRVVVDDVAVGEIVAVGQGLGIVLAVGDWAAARSIRWARRSMMGRRSTTLRGGGWPARRRTEPTDRTS